MSALREGLDLANAAIERWEESSTVPAPAWAVTNAFIQAIAAEENIPIKDLLKELK